MAAAIKQTKFLGDAEFAEAEAMRFDVQIAKDSSLATLIVEADVKEHYQVS